MRKNSKHIAILEDDSAQAELLQSWMTEAGFSFQLFGDGKSLMREIKNDNFDIMILDWELPDTTGIEVLTNIRSIITWHVPVLFTTSRDSENDVVTALEAGADDYLIKPLRKAEMFARLMALCRRFKSNSENNQNDFNFPPYQLYPSRATVKLENKDIQLTAKEFELALFLFNNQGRALSRGHILESVWGQRADLNTRTVDTHMSLIRQKLNLRPHNGFRLNTIYRHGYRLEKM